MADEPRGGGALTMSAEAQTAFIASLLERAAAIRLPDLLLREHPVALCRVVNRHGVGVVALRTRDASEERVKIMTDRLAQ